MDNCRNNLSQYILDACTDGNLALDPFRANLAR